MARPKKTDARWPKEVWHAPLAKILKMRLTEEGRFNEYSEKVKAKVAEGNVTTKAHNEVRKEYLKTEEEERAWYWEHLKKQTKELANKKASDKQKANIAAKKAANFAEALDMIENQTKVTLDDDLRWIYLHPALQRKSVATDQSARILITAEDILNPGHGEAPSRGAAVMLQQHVNDPPAFYEMYMKHAKGQKQVDTSGIPGGSEYSDDIGIEECRRLHRAALELEGAEQSSK
jgi:hypothetical protein